VEQGRISVNRAPVPTLWAAVVAQRLGFDRDQVEAFTLGSTFAGNAQISIMILPWFLLGYQRN
jgi:hypothetical protein